MDKFFLVRVNHLIEVSSKATLGWWLGYLFYLRVSLIGVGVVGVRGILRKGLGVWSGEWLRGVYLMEAMDNEVLDVLMKQFLFVEDRLKVCFGDFS